MIVPVLFLLAAAPTQKTAVHLERTRQWDELYLAFAAQKPDTFPAADRARIGKSLEEGCKALLDSDAVLAYSLGDKALAFHQTAEALLCVGRSAYKTEQPAAADKVLSQGLEQFPNNGGFGLELGRQRLEEGDAKGAISALERVVAASPEHSAAQALLVQARNVASGAVMPSEPAQTKERATTQPQTGTANGQDPRFLLKYTNDAHTLGERPEFEVKLVEVLAEAVRSVRAVLGSTRVEPLEVLLYRRADREQAHRGLVVRVPQGFFPTTGAVYRQSALHVDDGIPLFPSQKEQLLREYLKAVIDERAHGHAERVPEWMKQGLGTYVVWRLAGRDSPPGSESRERLKAAVRDHKLASLKMATSGPVYVYPPGIQSGEPYRSQYGIAMRLVVGQLGTDRLFSLFSTMGGGTKAQDALEAALGHPVTELEADVEAEIADL